MSIIKHFAKLNQDKLNAWLRGHPIKNLDPSEYRLDDNSNIIQFSQYGNRNSGFGWEIDHIYPSPPEFTGQDNQPAVYKAV